MANSNTFNLGAASVPLAGTEVVPIWNGTTTVKVSVANLTDGRNVSMADLTTTGNTSLGNAATDTLNVGAGGLVKDSSGNVSVGTATPRAKFDVVGTIRGSNNSTGATNTTLWLGAYGGSSSTAYGANIRIYHNFGVGVSTDMAFEVNGTTERMRILTGGDVKINTGNLVQGTAAKGVNFTANTPAAGMTSQLLNWYEEGTFTATLATGATTTPTATGYYTRVGRLLTVQLQAAFGVITSSGAAITITTNLGFTAAQQVTFSASGYNRVVYDSARILFWRLQAGTATFELMQSTTSAATVSGVAMQAGTFGPEFDFITVTYRV